MTPFLRQLLVVVSPQLAAFAVGGAVTYPSVLLQQFKANDSSIRLDFATSSWIGSIHGLTGIPSILMPLVMQWQGRRFAFIISCLFSIIGWILAYTAVNATSILISEAFHGLGTHCLIGVSLLSISEMVAPKFRTMAMVSFHLVQALGISFQGVIAKFLHWKTISLIMGMPVTLALLIACLWPESPSWLAYKGNFDKCEHAFFLLRGTDEASKHELQSIIASNKENLLIKQNTNKKNSKHFWDTIRQRDFYLPCIFSFMLFDLMYWSGTLVILIYGKEMVQKATLNETVADIGQIIVNFILFFGIGTTSVLIRFYNNKSVLLCSSFGTGVFLLSACIVSYLQTIAVLPKESLICFYFLIGYMIANSLGVNSITFTLAAELMPVKHRGIGGTFYVIFICLLHTASLKISPYLFLYIDLWGTLLIFFINILVCGLLIWKFVPETKGRTLQEIEDYYIDLSFKKRDHHSSATATLNKV